MNNNDIQIYISQFKNVKDFWNDLDNSKYNNYETYHIIKFVLENKSFKNLDKLQKWKEYVDDDLDYFFSPNQKIIDIINDIELECQQLLPFRSGLSFSDRILENESMYKSNKEQIIKFYEDKISYYKDTAFNERLMRGNLKLDYSLLIEYLENRITNLTDHTYDQDVIIPLTLEESPKIILINELNLHEIIRNQISGNKIAKDKDVITIISLLTNMKYSTVKRAMTFLKVKDHQRNEKNNPFKNEKIVFEIKSLISEIKSKYT